MSRHKEINLEIEICEHLAPHGWLHVDDDADQYDRCGRSSEKMKPTSYLDHEAEAGKLFGEVKKRLKPSEPILEPGRIPPAA